MNSQELLNLLKTEAKDISLAEIGQNHTLAKQEQSDSKTSNAAQLLSEYNQQTLLEIKSRECTDVIVEIDSAVLNEFSSRISSYLDKYAPGQAALKQYILLISTYLAFIARQPLHPVGLVFAGAGQIVSKGGAYYCPVKNTQLYAEFAVCRYCVSRDSSALITG